MACGSQRFKRLARPLAFSLGAVLLGALVHTSRVSAQCGPSPGTANTPCGTGALASATNADLFDSAFGFGALNLNTSGTENTAVGDRALRGNLTGNNNTATGAFALNGNNGDNNTADGYQALVGAFGDHDNTASGFQALAGNTTGSNNTASGSGALANNADGADNTATGFEALLKNTGTENTANGFLALTGNTTGLDNTADGVFSLVNNTTGSSNIGIGTHVGGNIVTGSNNIDIGGAGLTDESNTIRIGTPGTQKATFIAGIGDVMLSSGVPVVIDKNHQLGVMPSSARYKRDIRNMGSSSTALMTLRPVTFRYKNDPKGERQFGLIAEEVARVYPELVSYGPDGKPQTILYQNITAMLLNELQKQSTKLQEQSIQLHRQVVANQKQAQEIAQLRTRQEQQIGALEARLEALEHVKTARDANGVATATLYR
jgi:hypothetical protein